MDNSDTLSDPSSAAKNTFLDELESIKGILDDHQSETQTDVPLLNDVVSNDHQAVAENHPQSAQTSSENSDPPLNLLDLHSIFGNEAGNDDILSALNLDGLDTNIDIPQFNLQTVSTDDIPTLQVADDDAEPFAFPDDYSEDCLSSDQSATGADNFVTDDVIDSAEYREEQQEFFPSVDSDTQPVEVVAEIINDQNDDFDLELLIQEVVDEVIPTLENELRKRLSLCSPQLIKRLAEKIK